MTKPEFIIEFHRLEGGFPYLSHDPELRKSREAAYWAIVKDFSLEVWRRTVTLIHENWTEETFPLPYAVKNYIEPEAKRGHLVQHGPRVGCELCEGTGWKPITMQDRPGVTECDCTQG